MKESCIACLFSLSSKKIGLNENFYQGFCLGLEDFQESMDISIERQPTVYFLIFRELTAILLNLKLIEEVLTVKEMICAKN